MKSLEFQLGTEGSESGGQNVKSAGQSGDADPGANAGKGKPSRSSALGGAEARVTIGSAIASLAVMSTAAEILARVRELPIEERLALGMRIAEVAADECARSVSDWQCDQIKSVLADRVEGHFEDLPSKKAFSAREPGQKLIHHVVAERISFLHSEIHSPGITKPISVSRRTLSRMNRL